MSTAKRNPGEVTGKHPGDSAQSNPPSGTGNAAKRPPGQGPSPTAERHEPAASPAYESHRGRTAGIIFLIVLLAAAAAGAYAWRHFQLERQNERELVLQGNIDVRQVNLSFKVEGRIASLAVDEGDEVKAGQVIATLDKQYFDDDLRLARARRDNAKATLARLEHGSRPEEIASAKAQVAEQRATVTRSEQDFERAERLVGQGAVSRETFDSARSALDEARARLRAAEESERMAVIGPRQEDIDAARAQLAAEDASVTQSERRQTDSELIAPSDGVILTRAREKGAIVNAGETVFTLTLASPVWVRTYVNEQDLGRIHPNMAATVTTDSHPDKKYPGRIGFISPVAEFTPKTVETRELRTNLVYRLRVLVDNPDNGLRQGMPVTVTLDLTSQE
ncbi:MAG TPA: secretion protein HlyD [Pirellulales bacterium]|nr:secretion protein HlyD [Pirellulales bacterium]